MSDFFALLSRRALQPSTIHPRLPSRFEGDAGVPALATQEVQADAVPRASQLDSTAPAALFATPTAPPSVTVVPAALPVVEPALPPSPPRPESASLASPRPPLPSLVEPTLQALPVSLAPTLPLASPAPVLAAEALPAQAATASSVQSALAAPLQVHHERVEHHELSREVIERRVERLQPEHTLGLPSLATVSASVPAPAPVVASAPAPRVEISIGRIEVLPLEPVAPVRHEAAAKPAPAQSLDAYLQARSAAEPGRGGRR